MVALAGCSADPEVVSPVAGTAEVCRRLVAALPSRVADQPRRDVSPQDALGGAWGDPAIVLSCGVPEPQGYGDTSSCITVDGVDWYAPEEQLGREGDLTLTAVHREVYVEVALPQEYFPPATALADLSGPVAEAVPPRGHCV